MPTKTTMCKRVVLYTCKAKDFQDILKCDYYKKAKEEDLVACKYAYKVYTRWGSGRRSMVVCTHKNARRTKCP